MCMLASLQGYLGLVWPLLQNLSWQIDLLSSQELLVGRLGYPIILWSLP